MSMYALLRSKNKINQEDIATVLQGNLCRCTGYRPIIEGLKTFTDDWNKVYTNGSNGICGLGENCCKNNKHEEYYTQKLYNNLSFRPYDPAQEPIFPPDLKLNSTFYNTFLFYKGNDTVWLRPTNLKELYDIKEKIPHSKIVVGNTEVGIEIKFKKKHYPFFISPKLIKEMNIFEIKTECVIIGASVSLKYLESIINEIIIKSNGKGVEVFRELIDMLQYFAGNQIRNVASIVGNIITASPISDLNPILMACNAILNVYNPKVGYKKVVIDENFFISYRKTAVAEDEVVLSLEIPYTEKDQYFKAFKQARRREDDISIITAAFNIKFQHNSNTINTAKMCFGGMGPTTISAKKTAKVIEGMDWNDNLVDVVFQNLTEEFHLDESAPGGMAIYRKSLCLSMFFKFYLILSQKLNDQVVTEKFVSTNPKSSQIYEIRGKDRKLTDTVGLPIVHLSANKQVTGEAIYCDDIPPMVGELFLTFIFSSKAHAKIISINADKALSLPGVEAFLSAKDLTEEENKSGILSRDEEVFSSHVVTSTSCIIGAIVAKNENIARKAKDLVDIIYEEIDPVIISLEDAIANNSFYSNCPVTMKKGNIRQAFDDADFSLDGSFRSGAQEHFYLETNSILAIPKENELEIIASTQSPTELTVSFKILCLYVLLYITFRCYQINSYFSI